jgi:hypothetical protein
MNLFCKEKNDIVCSFTPVSSVVWVVHVHKGRGMSTASTSSLAACAQLREASLCSDLKHQQHQQQQQQLQQQ